MVVSEIEGGRRQRPPNAKREGRQMFRQVLVLTAVFAGVWRSAATSPQAPMSRMRHRDPRRDDCGAAGRSSEGSRPHRLSPRLRPRRVRLAVAGRLQRDAQGRLGRVALLQRRRRRSCRLNAHFSNHVGAGPSDGRRQRDPCEPCPSTRRCACATSARAPRWCSTSWCRPRRAPVGPARRRRRAGDRLMQRAMSAEKRRTVMHADPHEPRRRADHVHEFAASLIQTLGREEAVLDLPVEQLGRRAQGHRVARGLRPGNEGHTLMRFMILPSGRSPDGRPRGRSHTPD